MKQILYERQYSMTLGSTAQQIKYLERLATQLQNEMVDPGLKPCEKQHYATNITNIIKLIAEIQMGAVIEGIEEKIESMQKKKNNEVYIP